MSRQTTQSVRPTQCFKLTSLTQGLIWAHAALLGCVITVSAQADELQLTPMVITGVAQQSPIKVVTDPRIPRQPVPASDGADYLKTIPGFSALRSGGVNSDPVFRGMFGSRLKLLTNGGEMVGACPSRMDSPSSYISPGSYDELTVIKGPQTVQWGAGSSAATVLFERGPEQFDKPDYRLNSSVQVGSNRRFDRNIDGAIGSQEGYVRIIANASKAHDYNDGDGDRVPSRWNKWNSDFVVGWTPGDNTLLELTVGRGDGESRYAGRGMDGTQFLRESVALRFKQENLSDTWASLEAQVYYNYADHIMDNYKLRRTAAGKMPMATQVDTRTLGWRIKSTWQWSDFELVTGVDGLTSEHRLRARTGGAANKMGRPHSNMVKDAEFNQWGVFGELTWLLTDNERLISGLRVDRHKVEDHRDYLAMRRMIPTCPESASCTPNPTANKNRTETLPSAFVRYENDLQSIPATAYIGLGHAQRIPDYWELFSAAGANGSWTDTPSAFVSANPEKTTQVDFGIQYQQGPVEVWASAYVGQVRDYLMFTYTNNGSQVENIDARIMGGELGGSHRFAPGWKADASLAYAYGKNSSDGRAMPQIPPLEARFSMSYEQGDFSSAALWRVVAAQNRIDEGRGNVVGRDFGGSSGFGVFSLNTAYRLSQNWKVSAGVDNLFDKKYSEHLNLGGNDAFGLSADTRVNEVGRTWWARVDMKF
ncbi:TonB-dependent copper receptor [Denitrificimonas sp. JX-1]|uniref:TonB-dependent copper receptor n=1 Tax=Denitrificimonas halotolerans TaxID=3098930 RepID=A0ABU5GRE6_9GAMM|nr:TonB-dependent copper receptor [Denitrificimonas sp. JX-1]MDY7219562.1 TonB-dependent copper receptor [Denitrificimonas sp. JX-1]